MSGSGWDTELLHGHAEQADEQARMCGLLHHPEEEVAAEFETWDRMRDRGSVHLPSDVSYGSVALTIVPFPDAHRSAA